MARTPEVRKGEATSSSLDGIERRRRERFYDPLFDVASSEIDRIVETRGRDTTHTTRVRGATCRTRLR